VVWHAERTGKQFENDVIAVIGNCIFLCEAKSGRLDEVARRGGEISLYRNFRELFIEPGEQAWRLENYLNTSRENARLTIKRSGEEIKLNLDKPKIVHKFSICVEHFSSLTSAKHNLKALGLVSDDNAWAPVLSLGELQLVCRHLDSEVALFHYLTRRATLEELIDFEGDEQDILALYLTNGLCLDSKTLEGRQLRFMHVDRVVRQSKTPRADRTECVVYGIPLSPYWMAVIEDLYDDPGFPHRFDIIQVILNQDPRSLAAIEQHVLDWESGSTRKTRDLVFSNYNIGSRTFVLALHLSKKLLNEQEWQERSRTIAFSRGGPMFGATDCAVLLKVRDSEEWTFDAVSFFRMGKRAKPTLTES
jgi:hypothetical protein